METLYIACGLTALVALIALVLSLTDDSPPPQPPSLGVCSPSDSPYVPTFSQQESYHQPLHRHLPPLSPAIRYSQTPSIQALSSSQPSPYQPHRLPSAQYPPLATTPLLSRDASVPKPVCYTPQQPSRPATRAPLVPVVPTAINRPVARVPQVPVAPVVIDPHERPVARVPQVPVMPVATGSNGRPATRAPEVPVARVVIDPHEDPKSLRLKATQEGDRMGKCFKERNEAKARNDQQRAKELTHRGEAHRVNMMLLDKEASAKIFQENNQNRRNEVDLHGLYVSEARSYFDISVQGARDREESSLRVIVGKGNHSDNNTPKIKPAIQAHGESLGLSIEVDPRNDGCLIVNFK
ncbi:hypothetical protein BDR05DRAFT_1000601 [Suillus weaverae]|nr:hypothetical protein BDR05DRAFT_1000601 [Suillus weaverae]